MSIAYNSRGRIDQTDLDHSTLMKFEVFTIVESYVSHVQQKNKRMLFCDKWLASKDAAIPFP